MKRNTLSFRIISNILLITSTLFVLIFSVYYFYARNTISEASKVNAIQLAENIEARIEQELQPLEKVPQMLSATIEMGFFHEDSLIHVLQTIVRNNPSIYGACMAFEPHFFEQKGLYFMPYAYRGADGIFSAYLGSETYEYYYMDWYQIPAMLRTPYWSEPYYDEGGGNILMATYAVPVYSNRDNKRVFAGIATIDISLDKLTDLVSSVSIFETGYAFMITRNGVAVTHPDKSMIMNKSIFSNAEEWGAPLLRQIGRELQRGESKFRSYNLPGKEKRWIYYTNLISTRWSIAVVYPEREMYASLTKMNRLVILLFIAGLLLLVLLITKIVNRLASPLVKFAEAARLIAKGNFETPLPEVKTKDEMLELRQAFVQMQEQLTLYIENLKKTTSEKEKIESELRIASDIQLSMIPHSFPPFPDLPQVDLYASLKSAKEVGGDLYDFFLIDSDKFCFAIGDVSGKGVPASLFMAVTRTLLRSIADRHKTPDAIMKVLNKSLALNNDSCMFVTFFLGILNLKNGELFYSNAGHNPPLYIARNGETNFMEMGTSIPLGLNEEYDYSCMSAQMMPGDKIFAYTDGVSEAENATHEFYGEKRLQACIAKNYEANTREIIDLMTHEIDQYVDGYMQSDDITMLTLVYNGQKGKN
ncbi:MAG: SpoIIE family protein phosphatase [Bacteroidales bacterium]|mgnify:CR=1 FL=1|jgi:sigma-B regulation protein RsbU (phosphoserine phosphatase)|nr:SpoIIE family protein phosphatase [Bacteroidales bacterium]HOI32347.1 SpoIIE family protein phosphatase [Bacteroidales bacterium]